jgi:hypothetical protein
MQVLLHVSVLLSEINNVILGYSLLQSGLNVSTRNSKLLRVPKTGHIWGILFSVPQNCKVVAVIGYFSKVFFRLWSSYSCLLPSWHYCMYHQTQLLCWDWVFLICPGQPSTVIVSIAALLVPEIIVVNIMFSVRCSNSTIRISQLERLSILPLVWWFGYWKSVVCWTEGKFIYEDLL